MNSQKKKKPFFFEEIESINASPYLLNIMNLQKPFIQMSDEAQESINIQEDNVLINCNVDN